MLTQVTASTSSTPTNSIIPPWGNYITFNVPSEFHIQVWNQSRASLRELPVGRNLLGRRIGGGSWSRDGRLLLAHPQFGSQHGAFLRRNALFRIEQPI